MTGTICLDEKYSTTRLLCKIVDDECLMLDKDGRIKEECKWNINNLELNIQNSKLIGNPDDKFETVLFLPEGEGRKGEGGFRTKGYFKKSYGDKPLISIITVILNGEKYLEETIQSVINQTYDNVEYIIIDGGSTDGTLDIIKKYEDKIDYWVSERDGGIYDAMNKGIDVASGEVIGIINADDWYEKNAIGQIVSCYIKTDGKTILHGNLNIIEDEKLYCVAKPQKKLNVLKKRMILKHPTVFVPITIYKKLGLFSTEYKIVSDWEFMLKCHMNNINFMYINKIIANFRIGGISSNFDMKYAYEKHLVRKSNGTYVFIDRYYLFDIIKLKLKLLGRNLSTLSNFKRQCLNNFVNLYNKIK